MGRRRVRRAWLAQERPGQFRFRHLRPFVKAILNTHRLADGEREGRTAVQPLAVLRREGPHPEHPQRHGPVLQADPRPPLRLPRQQRLRQDHAAPAHRERRAARLPEASPDAAGGSGAGGGRSQRCRRSRVSVNLTYSYCLETRVCQAFRSSGGCSGLHTSVPFQVEALTLCLLLMAGRPTRG